MMFEMYSKQKTDAPSVVAWHWRLVKIATHKILACSPESFATKVECEANIHLIMMADYKTPIFIVSEKHEYDVVDELIRTVVDSRKSSQNVESARSVVADDETMNKHNGQGNSEFDDLDQSELANQIREKIRQRNETT